MTEYGGIKVVRSDWLLVLDLSFQNNAETWDQMLVEFYFEQQAKVAKLRLSSFLELFQQTQRHKIIPLVLYLAKNNNFRLGIP